VYLDVKEVAAGDASTGVGKVCDLLTKGRLPYTLRWRAEITEGRPPEGFTIAATGDFMGCGVWTIRQDGPDVDITFDWRLRAEKPLIRGLSLLFKPLFRANHLWAMARGQEGLRAELARPRAAGAAQGTLLRAGEG
jgi:hypothetical protein